MRPEAKKAVAESADCRIFHCFFFLLISLRLYLSFFFLVTRFLLVQRSLRVVVVAKIPSRNVQRPMIRRFLRPFSCLPHPVFFLMVECRFEQKKKREQLERSETKQNPAGLSERKRPMAVLDPRPARWTRPDFKTLKSSRFKRVDFISRSRNKNPIKYQRRVCFPR